jgi:DnaJ homolog subfamily A member 2
MKVCLGKFLLIISYRRPFDKGVLYVTFEINFPDSNWASEDNLRKLAVLLPAPKPLPHVNAEEVVLSEVDATRQKSSQNATDEMDEDEGHGPQVQCAQQ